MQTIKEIIGKVESNVIPERDANAEGNFYIEKTNMSIGPGMNERIQNLRKLSFETEPSLSIERAIHQTVFYKENSGKSNLYRII